MLKAAEQSIQIRKNAERTHPVPPIAANAFNPLNWLTIAESVTEYNSWSKFPKINGKENHKIRFHGIPCVISILPVDNFNSAVPPDYSFFSANAAKITAAIIQKVPQTERKEKDSCRITTPASTLTKGSAAHKIEAVREPTTDIPF